MVSLLLDFFDKLKREGLYDDAFIIVCGDHGAEFQPIFDGVPVTMKHGRVPALLAVKTPGSKGPMKVSDAQTALSDIPATIMDVLLLDKTYEGVSIRSEDELKDRRRKFIIPLRGESVQQYIVTGSIYDASSWARAEDVAIEKRAVHYQWGEVVQFGMTGNADKFKRKGWSFPLDNHELNDGKEVSLFMLVDAPKGDIALTVSFFPLLHPEKVPRQRVNVLVNGKEVGEWLIEKPGGQTRSLLIPQNVISSEELEIVFKLPDAARPNHLNIGVDGREWALAFVNYRLVPHHETFTSEQVSLQIHESGKAIKHYIDTYEDLSEGVNIIGWGYLDGLNTDDIKHYVVLKKSDKTIIYSSQNQLRKDVTTHFKDSGLDLDHSGFFAKVPKKGLQRGEYQVGLYIVKSDYRGVIYTDKYVTVE